MNKQELQAQRNLRGKELEKEGRIQDAISYYEQNIIEGFDGSFPYERLAILYKKEGKTQDQIRVLESAVAIFNKLANSGRTDSTIKLQSFEAKLKKVREGQK